MRPTRWLSVAEVMLLHDLALELHGGKPGRLDPGRLESAVLQAQAEFGGQLLHPTLHGQAAAYLFHIATGHTFADGNKRTGLLAALTFLELNGSPCTLSEDAAYELALAVGRGELDKAQTAARLRNLEG
ncbi:Toxin Doc [Calidithermus terrae]|uniref:Toxin Doc n=1 Tax=Calidithermus terrae TaxID=1408545 RepID=A0A399EAU6_9DEIN|nr:type II toxin-antitoxin system death-on-curing family toxin [Calidithermus terrae]RIH80583.1 Toxin Doc [Calidithermus terrae]